LRICAPAQRAGAGAANAAREGNDMADITRRFRALAAGITATLALGVGGAAAQSSVDIGLLAPFSGPWAEHGKFMRIGAEMAVEEINKQGGIKALDGAKINLVVADTGPSVETATNAAQRLLSGGKLTAFTCCFLSSFSLAASEIGERLQVPMLTFSYSDVLVGRGYKYTFRDSSGADFQVRAAAELLKREAARLGKTIRTAALAGDNTAASVAYFKSLGEVLPKNDLRIVLNRVWTPPLTDAIPVALAVRDANPDLVFLGATSFDDSVGIVRAFNATGVKKLALGNGAQFLTPEFLDALGPQQAEGVMATQGTAITKDPYAADFLKRFRERTGIRWTVHDTTSVYSQLWIIKAALEKAGTADSKKVRDAIASIHITTPPPTAFSGVDIQYDANGQNPKAPTFIVQWQNGLPVLVAPGDFAVAPLKWPS
jgi:branched-chain amino acid transport system substrate-binding protein